MFQQPKVTTAMIGQLLDPRHMQHDAATAGEPVALTGTAARVNASFDAIGHKWSPSATAITRTRNTIAGAYGARQNLSVKGLPSSESGIYHAHDLIEDTFSPDDVDSILSERLKQHQELMQQHHAALDRQRQWLSGTGRGGLFRPQPARTVDLDESAADAADSKLRNDLFMMPVRPETPRVDDPLYTNLSFDAAMVSPTTNQNNSPGDGRRTGSPRGSPMSGALKVPLFTQPTQSSLRKRSSTGGPRGGSALTALDVIASTAASPTKKSVSIVEGNSQDPLSKTVVLPSDHRLMAATESSSLRRVQTMPPSAAKDRPSATAAVLTPANDQALQRAAAAMLDNKSSAATTPANSRPSSPRVRASSPPTRPKSDDTSIRPRARSRTPEGARAGWSNVESKVQNPYYHAKRMAEIEVAKAAKDDEELRELTFTPRLTGNSERLAQRHRRRQGVDGLAIAESLTARHELANKEKWIHAQYIHALEVPARPKVNSARPQDDAVDPDSLAIDVVDRLYSVSRSKSKAEEAELRDLVGGALDDDSRYTPAITAKAKRLQRKPGHSVGDDLHLLGKLKVERQAKIAELKPPSAEPRIDAVSDMIASRLPESTWERLQGSTRALVRNADGTVVRTRSAPAGVDRSSFTPRINAASARTAKRLRQNQSSKFDRKAKHLQSPSLSDETDGSEETDHADALHQDAKRWAQRKEQLRQQAEERELAGHTFKPQLAELHRTRPKSTTGGAATPRGGGDAAPHVGTHSAARGDEYLRYQPKQGSRPALEDRMQQWEARRQQRVEEARVRTAAEQDEAQPMDPALAPDARRKQLERVEHASSIYGGDAGTPWGASEHIERQRAARLLKAEKEDAARAAFTSGENWTNSLTVPVDVQLGRKRGDDNQHTPRRGNNQSGRSTARDKQQREPENQPLAHVSIDAAMQRHYAADYTGLRAPSPSNAHGRGVTQSNGVTPPSRRGMPSLWSPVAASAPDPYAMYAAHAAADSRGPSPFAAASLPQRQGAQQQQQQPQASATDVLARAREALSRAQLASSRI
jgi:hypothetical protein